MVSFFNRSNGWGAAASTLPVSSSILSTQPNPLAQLVKMPNGEVVTYKVADAVYHPTEITDPMNERQLDAPPPPALDKGYHPLTAGDPVAQPPGIFDQFGPWLWIVPAGVVAVGLGYFFLKHRKSSVSGYRRRRRSRSRR